MSWWQSGLFGAGGGLSVELLAVFRGCMQWQAARRTASGRRRARPPALWHYLDTAAHACLAVLRAGMGAATALLFAATGQISGAYAAVALGVSAPAVLATLGAVPQVANLVAGSPVPAPANNGVPRGDGTLEATGPGGGQ
ncbi:hypothetical protein ABZ876_20805 [Streptomyces sp. NPDC046931]|uniref:hypothetical protein n=1 Tax=Streptomyces sp. NPDC046931 TaxID=3154806 RepID=UPI0033DFD455